MRNLRAILVGGTLALIPLTAFATTASAHGGAGFGGGQAFGGHFGGGMPSEMHGGDFGAPHFGGFDAPHVGGFGAAPHIGGFGTPPVGGFDTPHNGGFGAAPHFGGFGTPPVGGFGVPHFGGTPYPEQFHDGYGFGPRHRYDVPFVPYYLNEYGDDDDYGETCLAYPSYNPSTGTYVGPDGQVYYCP
jgi:hypothetical protein